MGAGCSRAPDLYLGAAGIVAGFVIGCPFFLSEFNLFLDHVADDIYTYAYAGRRGRGGSGQLGRATPPTPIATGPGRGPPWPRWPDWACVLYRMNAALAVFVSFPILYYGYYSTQRINYRPNLLPDLSLPGRARRVRLLRAPALGPRRRPRAADAC